MSVNPYEETERLSVAGAGSREVESWALLELAKRLDRVRKEQEQKNDPSALSEIVRLNWRAWTIIQSSLLDESNPLSPELRGDLLTLCAFIDKHSTQLLNSPNAEKVQILIDINMHLGQGLRGERLSDAEQKAIMKVHAQTASQETGATAQQASSAVNEKGNEEDRRASAPAKKAPQKVETGIAVDL